MSDLARNWKLYIDGKWTDAGGGTFDVINPATEETVAKAPNATTADLERAIAAARRAFDEGPWRRTTPQDRARIIERLVAALEKRRDRLREILVSAAGATFVSLPIQLDLPYQLLGGYADLVRSFHFEDMLPVVVSETPMGTTVNNSMVYHPGGRRRGLIPTWNFPFFTTVQKIDSGARRDARDGDQAVARTGAHRSACRRGGRGCDLPPGCAASSPAIARSSARRWSKSPLVDKISFTGSAVTGKRIMAAAAPT